MDLMTISIVGTVLSLFIQWMKNKLGTNSIETKFVTILLALAIGSLYFFLKDTSWYQSVLGVLAASSTVYALLLKKEK